MSGPVCLKAPFNSDGAWKGPVKKKQYVVINVIYPVWRFHVLRSCLFLGSLDL